MTSDAKLILLLTGPHFGNVHPTLPLIRELTDRGHEVKHLTTDYLAETSASYGASTLTYESAMAKVDPAEVFASGDPLLPHTIYLRENLAIQEAAEAAFGDSPPDVILYEDSPFIAGRILAHRWGRPAIRLSVGFATNENYSYYEAMAQASGIPEPLSIDKFREIFTISLRERGVDTDPDDFWYSIENHNIVFIPRSFQIEGDTFDDRFVFVGPCLEGRDDPEWTPPADSLASVLVSLGTNFNDHPEWFKTCAEAFNNSDWHVVMTVGTRLDREELDLPANVETHRWISHMAVLRHAKVCVTHGGMGTVMQALHLGRPMVTVPHFAFEVQPMADQVKRLGLGMHLRPDQFDARALYTAVNSIAGDPKIRDAVAGIREEIRLAGGAQRAADVIEAVSNPQ